MRSAWLATIGCLGLVWAGCTERNLNYVGDGSVSGSCAGLDRASCGASPLCEVLSCPGCNGQTTYAGCAAAGSHVIVACPEIACAPDCTRLSESACDQASGQGCSVALCCGQYNGCYGPTDGVPACNLVCVDPCQGLSQSACAANSECEALTCPGCGGTTQFIECWNQSKPPPPINCPNFCPACQTLAESECAKRADCHRVYSAFLKNFSVCSPGLAICQPEAQCLVPPPDCGNQRTPEYLANTCVADGCVFPSDCSQP